MTVQEIVAENNTVIALVNVTATHQGEFWEKPTSRNHITIQELLYCKDDC